MTADSPVAPRHLRHHGYRPLDAQVKPRAVRRDIQTLRAAAVGMVVLNHVWPGRLPGGYIGVDVFFVISGYLISNHLLSEVRRTGRVHLARFYARRARRLLPAALLVAVVALAAVFIWQPFNRWVVSAQETVASAFYVENWILAAKSVDYSAHSESASTVQHYWSLSVEEQFYLLWPLLLVGAWALAAHVRLRPLRIATLMMGVIGLLSFAFCVWYTVADRSPAYFVTPGRAWEFAAGALVAALQSGLRGRRLESPPSPLRGALQTLGILMVGVAAFAFDERTLFPGYLAALPVLGTVLIILAGPQRPAWSPIRLGEFRPVQYLGDISYSVYLWHWPLVVLTPSILSRQLHTIDRAGIVAASIVLASLTKHFVEDPGRTRLLASSSPRKVLLATAAAMSLVALSSGAVIGKAGLQQADQERRVAAMASGACFGAAVLAHRSECGDPFGPATLANVGDGEAPWFDTPECKSDADPLMAGAMKVLLRCDFAGGEPSSADVWLVGDSHAEQWKVAVHELAKKNHWILYESLVGGCPVVDVKRVAFMGAPSNDPATQNRCLNWSASLTDRIKAEQPEIILVSAFGSGEVIDDGSGRSQLDQYREATKRRLGAWADAGSQVVVIRDVPQTLHRSTPDCVALNRATPLECSNPKSDALLPDPMAAAVPELKDPRVKVLDLADQFCPDERCYAVIGGVTVFFDKDHAARSYTRSLLPVMEGRFFRVIQGSR